jgi:hypothetical protein
MAKHSAPYYGGNVGLQANLDGCMIGVEGLAKVLNSYIWDYPIPQPIDYYVKDATTLCKPDQPSRVTYLVIWSKKRPALVSLGKYVQYWKQNKFPAGGFHFLSRIIF